MTDYLTVVEVLTIHNDQINRDGVRDMGLLEAALFRPQTGYYTDIIAQAAALWESLSQNHPFVDGNKHIAFAAAFTFMTINNTELTADADDSLTYLLELYDSGNLDYENLEPWLRSNTIIRS